MTTIKTSKVLILTYREVESILEARTNAHLWVDENYWTFRDVNNEREFAEVYAEVHNALSEALSININSFFYDIMMPAFIIICN